MSATKEQTKAVREAIASCRDKHGDIIPDLVVKSAKSPRSPMHKYFIWDDKIAAHAHRLERARELIREVKLRVVIEDVKFATPFYVSNPSRKDSAYMAVTAAAKDEAISEAILVDELRRIEQAVVRARGLAAAFDLTPHFDRMLSDLLEIRGRLSRKRLVEEETRASA